MSEKKLENEISITVDNVIIKGGHNDPPKKKKDDPIIPINESDVDNLDYMTEG